MSETTEIDKALKEFKLQPYVDEPAQIHGDYAKLNQAIELLLLEARKNELTRLLDTRTFEHIIQPQAIQDKIIELTAQRSKLIDKEKS